MLIKEYRICLPMSVEEYRIAQLYMIQKKSRVESSGSESGVEILVNDPYEGGPGGSGQYTHKLYHIGSHLPGWFRSILPKSALIVEEEAWNAYPYTKTIYRTPFIEKFSLEIETVYYNDAGTQDNVFNLTKSDLSNRIVDYIDIVTDVISSGDYQPEEDPTKFVSEKTGRGPLNENWREEYAGAMENNDVRDGSMNKKTIMCAYKLCKVEFKYWGMQTKIERFIHDVALRKTMLRAHKQAWCWQDEYHGLTMADISNINNINIGNSGNNANNNISKILKLRRLELETQQKLKEKMAGCQEKQGEGEEEEGVEREEESCEGEKRDQMKGAQKSAVQEVHNVHHLPTRPKVHYCGHLTPSGLDAFYLQTIERLQHSSSEEEDEYFDADEGSFVVGDNDCGNNDDYDDDDYLNVCKPWQKGRDLLFNRSALQSIINHFISKKSFLQTVDDSSSSSSSPTLAPKNLTSFLESGNSEVLFILLHGGSAVDSLDKGIFSKMNDLSTLNSTFEQIIRSRYSSMIGRIFIELVPCPNLCARPIQLLSIVGSIYAYDLLTSSSTANNFTSQISSPTLPAHSANNNNGTNDEKLQTSGNQQVEFHDFHSDIFISMYDLNTASDNSSNTSDNKTLNNNKNCSNNDPNNRKTSSSTSPSASQFTRNSSLPTVKSSSTTSPHQQASTAAVGHVVAGMKGLNFEVDEVFLFGSPLGMVLAYRMHTGIYKAAQPPKPTCNQLYNIFYPSDPCAFRIEPLVDLKFKVIEPIKLKKYNKFSYGESVAVHLVETIHNFPDVFALSPSRDITTITVIILVIIVIIIIIVIVFTREVSANWWGVKRLDYCIYCPEALQNFPSHSLPHILHSSFWESCDLVAFILRQTIHSSTIHSCSTARQSSTQPAPHSHFTNKEKWLKKRTQLKVRNLAPNHRANDVIVLESRPQLLAARFMYGPLDVVSLSGEKVDISVTVRGQEEHLSTELTDQNGRIVYHIPEHKKLSAGLYSVNMTVRVDQSSASFYMVVLPARTEVVVFSIDGSFTASVSIMGRDPKVKPGAVDVVRCYHERGYLIIYITARPDMQHRRVTKWLARHNFPHGLVWFADGLSAEPLKQKASNLRQLVREAELVISAAYGSNKDVPVYQSIGLQPNQIFVVGKVSKKNKKEATVISNGYASHLTDLLSWSVNLKQVNQKLTFRTGSFQLKCHNTHQQHLQIGTPGSQKSVKVLQVVPESDSYQDTITSMRRFHTGRGGADNNDAVFMN
ncbi:hypothetical protein HELRODRAFT_67527 [Helobdella robusta]|uniref:DDHD domain-containing protein n=1 Tax=Helobdella robusta TaxID=6412 RepID=T1FZ22_HELRO|nr:hypothetical protein HELRODRAFT_67527 [Helobdella robusta]ESN96762.1 hypothetical protein HELRODRAFT_67527 [Helobdella robusta]